MVFGCRTAVYNWFGGTTCVPPDRTTQHAHVAVQPPAAVVVVTAATATAQETPAARVQPPISAVNSNNPQFKQLANCNSTTADDYDPAFCAVCRGFQQQKQPALCSTGQLANNMLLRHPLNPELKGSQF
eukprot:m.316961 g.316961  ORF g.316961 m.316961 type:complete len:129 (+) comp23078_c0_seq4:476-862(+)